MKTYILYIVGLVALMAALALSIHAHLLWPSVALGVALLWLCLSLYGRIGRLLYAYRETEKESERLHTQLAESERQLQYLRQLTENVDTALFVCSTDGRIDWMNHAAKASLLSPHRGRTFCLPVSCKPSPNTRRWWTAAPSPPLCCASTASGGLS